MTRVLFLFILAAAIALAYPAQANTGIKYYPDPVYKKLNDDDPHPMSDMLDLAKQGDVRAQFIIGDLYSKGKGGLPKDLKEAHHWFEESAMHGYAHGFIRLAALAKHEKNFIEAWQWYALAIRELDGDEEKYAIQARNELTESAKLPEDALRQARKNLNDWEDRRDAALRAEKDAEANKTPAGKTAEAQPHHQHTPAGVSTNE